MKTSRTQSFVTGPLVTGLTVLGGAGLLAVVAGVVGTQIESRPAPRPVAVPLAEPLAEPIAEPIAEHAAPTAEFAVPLYVPTPPIGVVGPSQDGGAGPERLLGPDDVITPQLAVPTTAPRAVFRPL